jgi:nucleoid DNA-binding protein
MIHSQELLDSKKSWNKKDLSFWISQQLGVPKSEANIWIRAFTDAVSEGLIKGKKITLSDFGSFSVSDRSSFKGTHPQTGEEIEVTKRRIPVFKVGKKLKQALNPHLDSKDE